VSKSNQINLFPDELGVLLEYMSSFSTPIAITGDMHVRFDRPDDPMTHRINEFRWSMM